MEQNSDMLDADDSAQQHWLWPDVPNNRNAFLEDLEEYHAERGTLLDKEPKVSNRQIDLWKLFQTVEEKGGYDNVSSEKLAWRKLASDFGLNQPAYAFQLKTIFYRNLAAYAIKKIHHQEPPPKEILEDLTARGGDLLTRTRENYEPHSSRNILQDNPLDGPASADEGDGVLRADKNDAEDSPANSRGGRSLRQAPPQRQMFIPDMSSPRQTRGSNISSNATQPVIPLPNGVSNVGSGRFDPLTYEAPTIQPQSLRAVSTSMNQPLTFRTRTTNLRAQHRLAQSGDVPQPKGLLMPGTGSEGAVGSQIYVRVLNSLRSPLETDKQWALHHLVKISEIQGQRFRLDSFPGMVESLLETLLEVAPWYYDVQWRISYSDQSVTDVNVLDGLRGTPDVLSRIKALPRINNSGQINTKRFTQVLNMCNEAALCLRNLALSEPNAFFLAYVITTKDVLSIILHLPREPELVELQHYAMDIAEQLVKYLPLKSSDPLFLAFVDCVEQTDDRGTAIGSLRALCRIAAVSQDANLLPQVSTSFLNRIQSWLFLEDDELVQACLEFLYQYTAVPSNVQSMLEDTMVLESPTHPLLDRLVRLLKHNAKEDVVRREIASSVPARKVYFKASLPDALLEILLPFEEPKRASTWLKCMFEEDSKADITQLELWQSYQNSFATRIEEKGLPPLMTAADFIKNVSVTLSGATARIVKSDGGGGPRFIMSGIRYRHPPTDPQGREFMSCRWKADAEDECARYFRPGPAMLDHVLADHLGLPVAKVLINLSSEDSKRIKVTVGDCYWNGCKHFSIHRPDHSPSSFEITKHVNLHMAYGTIDKKVGHPKASGKSVPPNDPNRVYGHQSTPTTSTPAHPAIFEYNAFYDTMVDEKNHSAGVAYWSVMTLRNLARSVPKAIALAKEDPSATQDSQDKAVGSKIGDTALWSQRLFLPFRYHIFHVAAYNRVLAPLLFDLILLLDKAMYPKQDD